jgi:hypothetical protein
MLDSRGTEIDEVIAEAEFRHRKQTVYIPNLHSDSIRRVRATSLPTQEKNEVLETASRLVGNDDSIGRVYHTVKQSSYIQTCVDLKTLSASLAARTASTRRARLLCLLFEFCPLASVQTLEFDSPPTKTEYIWLNAM